MWFRGMSWCSAWLVTLISMVLKGRVAADRSAAAQQPPHLLVILVDDLGYNNVGFHNKRQISPEIDHLAKEQGIVLEALYTFR